MIQALELALELAPQREWRSAGCSYGLVIATLQASEQALRQTGLHTSANQLQQLLAHFLRSRRGQGLEGSAPPERRRQVETLPRRPQATPRRRLPRLRNTLQIDADPLH